MSIEQEKAAQEVRAALNILMKKWGLKTHYAVVRRLIEENDPTTLQLARRKLDLQDRQRPEDK